MRFTLCALRDPVLALPVVASAIFASRGTPCPVIVCDRLRCALFAFYAIFANSVEYFQTTGGLDFSFFRAAAISKPYQNPKRKFFEKLAFDLQKLWDFRSFYARSILHALLHVGMYARMWNRDHVRFLATCVRTSRVRKGLNTTRARKGWSRADIIARAASSVVRAPLH